ncbi:methyltransferase domain-containing protein [Streptomyces sp. NBC_01716]|uniref:methyltransferase domain-containing protein n=1 Tax=Streptomyces sp. NBC_01716 TaxID=2975917 RepID=UPI002E352FB5|nr:methyltransferase domain-containing protein [Streptomyces sp. NBC_01716]
MTRTLVQHGRQQVNAASSDPSKEAGGRARDWAEIQERMLVPLYEAVYERLEVGPGTRLLGLGCGSGLALLIATARGAEVTGVDADQERVALARERLVPDERPVTAHANPSAALGGAAAPGRSVAGPSRTFGGRSQARVLTGGATAVLEAERPVYDVITAFQPIGVAGDDSDGLGPALAEAVPMAGRGTPVVVAGWGPPERCATSGVLRVAGRLTERLRKGGGYRAPLRDDLEDVAARAGLKPDGSGRVSCPFGYAGMESALRGLLSTGAFDEAVRATDQSQVEKEITEALHPHVRRDGTVWMPNVFRYLIARTP